MATGLATRGGLPVGADGSFGAGNTVQTRGGSASLGQKALLGHGKSQQRQAPAFTSFPRSRLGKHSVSATLLEAEPRASLDKGQRLVDVADAFQGVASFQGGSLPSALYKLLDPDAPVELPPPHKVSPRSLDNRELDKLVAALGRSKATWRRALVLHEWLLDIGHLPDDRLCTTLMRVCHQQGQAVTALSLYEWMRAQHQEGGAGLVPSVYTYTTAMRAALSGNLLEKALKVWDDAVANGCQPDCRMCTALIEVAARKGDTARALQMYDVMRVSAQSAVVSRDARMTPSVHAYTAAMRAAAEGGLWERALEIWSDMEAAGVTPTGHAFAAAISACAAGGCWQRAVQLFDRMLDLRIRPDVVSCTALITALGTDGQWERAERVVEWMARSGIKPNVRTYTALVTALGNAKQWDRAISLVQRMKNGSLMGGVEPNSYTYSALLKTMGEHGQWKLAEQVFEDLEAETLRVHGPSTTPSSSVPSLSGMGTASSRSSGYGAPSLATIPGSPVASSSSAAASVSASAPGSPHQSLEGPNSLHWRAAASGADPAAAAALAVHLQGLSVSDAYDEAEANAAEAVALDMVERVLRCSMDVNHPSNVAAMQQAQATAHKPASTAMQGGGFSYFTAADPMAGAAYAAATAAGASPAAAAAAATAATSMPTLTLLQQLEQQQAEAGTGANNAVAAHWGLERSGSEQRAKGSSAGRLPAGGRSRGPVNEVVCGAMMLAYERAGRWEAAVNVLERARRMGIQANTIMCNTAISALGKAGKWEAAEQVFLQMPPHDAVSYETLLAAYGMSGKALQSEATFTAMLEAGHVPRDYAYCGLIAAHSLASDWRAAVAVATRMRAAGVAPTVHVYNALLAACERHQQWDMALELRGAMLADGIPPNAATFELLESVSKKGAAAVADQQAAAAALSAVVAAAGTMLMRTGYF